mgnify:CR=1 FL=1
MPVTFTNNFKNILDKLRSILRTEFKKALPIYVGSEEIVGNQYIRLNPSGSTLSTYATNSEIREYSIEMLFHFNDANIKKTSLDHVLRYTARIEALIHDNMNMTLSDSSNMFDCRVDGTNIEPQEEGGYIINFDFKCMHQGNLS